PGQVEGERFLARTKETDSGIPVLSLKRGKDDSPFLILATGPLCFWDYHQPEYFEARSIFLDAFRKNGGEPPLQGLIDVYNTRLDKRLGARGKRYQLIPLDSNQTGQILVRTASVHRITSRIHLMLSYDRLGCQVFCQTLAAVGGEGRGAAVAASMVEEIIAEMGVTSGSVRPEFRSFIFQILFQEIYGLNSRGPGGGDFILRVSPEDVLFSILNDEEVGLLQKWYGADGVKKRLISRIEEGAKYALAPEGVETRLDAVLDRGIAMRLEHGPGALGRASLSILHSHPKPASRRAIFMVGDTPHLLMTLSNDSVQQWGDDALYWMEGELVQHYREMIDNSGSVSPYDLCAARFVTAARKGMTKSFGPGDAKEYGALLRGLAALVPKGKAVFDFSGRIPRESQGWWRALYRVSGDLIQYARARGLDRVVANHPLLDKMASGFGVLPLGGQVKACEVWIHGGKFHSWRGAIRQEELGVGEEWQPGNPLGGYSIEGVEPGIFLYRQKEGEVSELPGAFFLHRDGGAV
ncbi:MAG: hypothetical protein MI749_11705, partial [Desulfovibrionales bacterium]|nr:hypothetical protein [Desulfovibrionales bacterium]